MAETLDPARLNRELGEYIRTKFSEAGYGSEVLVSDSGVSFPLRGRKHASFYMNGNNQLRVLVETPYSDRFADRIYGRVEQIESELENSLKGSFEKDTDIYFGTDNIEIDVIVKSNRNLIKNVWKRLILFLARLDTT